MKKIFSLFLVSMLLLCSTSMVFADSNASTENNSSSETIKTAQESAEFLNDRNTQIVDLLEDNADSNSYDKVLKTFFDQNPEYKVNDNYTSAQKLVDTETIELDKSTSITFYPDGSFDLSKLTEEDVTDEFIPNKSALKINSSNPILAAAAKTQYKHASHDITRYGSTFGNAIYSLHIECDFGYNGTKAWDAGGCNGNYTRGSFTIWQVSNWEVGTTPINDGEYCRAYARGNFHFGVEIKGEGFKVQEKYNDLRVSVTKDGKVYQDFKQTTII